MHDLTWCVRDELDGRCLYRAQVVRIAPIDHDCLMLQTVRIGWEGNPLPRERLDSRLWCSGIRSWRLQEDWRRSKGKCSKRRPTREKGTLPWTAEWEVWRVQRFDHGLVFVCRGGPDVCLFGPAITLEMDELPIRDYEDERVMVRPDGERL